MAADSNLTKALVGLGVYNRADIGAITSIPLPPNSNTSYIPKEYPIQGEMLTVRKTITMEMWQNIPPEVIKREALSLLIDEMMKSKHIEFTMMKDTSSRDMIRIAARIFVTPDSQVRLLREKGY
jgi:hypothetical protein